MKHNFSILGLLLLLGAMAMPAFSQVSNDNEDEVNKVDQRLGQDFVPGQVLVKMKDSSPANVRRVKGKFKSAGISQLDAVLQEFGVEGMEQLLPHEKPGRTLRKAKAFNGNIIQERDLSQLYLLQMKEEKQMETQQLVERLAELPEVEFAEPNYKAYIMADVDDYAAEPLYNQQWGLPAINLPQLWGAEKISQKRPVIAILDTGIDISHPDLAANIWTNTAEAEGEEGYDNDNNGFKNDVHGWDFINQTGNIRDFNGHGTHCAGIAAAVGNNGVGITDEAIAKIMSDQEFENDMREDSNGIGLQNVISRLRLFYDTNDIFEISSLGENKGTRVVISIPLSRKEEEVHV